MKTFVVVVVLMLIEFGWCGFGAELAAPVPARQARQQLLEAKFFAFGGVGFAGTKSEGEKAFQEVLTSPDALLFFKAAVTNDNPVARLYALIGIRKLESESFDKLAMSLRDSNPRVTTMTGCMVNEERATDVLDRIKAGSYDALLLQVRPVGQPLGR
jgi:hypothetical protein